MPPARQRVRGALLAIVACVALSAHPAAAGLVVMSGDDADDGRHCLGTACGALYPRILSKAMAQSPGERDILAVGVRAGGVAAFALDGWNDPANGGPGADIDLVTGADIRTVDLNLYRVLYVPSDVKSVDGGISDADLTHLATRRADIVRFVNERGGSLVALTESQASPSVAYAWLPLPLTFVHEEHETVAPTPALFALVPGVTTTPANLSHRFYHTVWTGPPGFLGLTPLAREQESGRNGVVLLGGRILSPEGCDNGVDDDGDTLVDNVDPDCQVCGDGDATDPGEECDDGNRLPGDGCSAACQREVCGNARVDAGEECDDGNGVPDDGCTADCRRERCPDGTLDAGEECDDGNRIDGDCCSNACRAAPEGMPCPDGDGCDGDEVCRAGTCSAPTREEGLACLGDHLAAFVTNFDDGSVSRIDVATGAVAGAVGAGAGPWAAAVHPAGTEVYVTNREGNEITVLDARDGTLLARIAVPPRPLGVVFDLDGSRAYVASYDADSVSVVDTGSRSVVATIATGRGPSGLTMSPGGTRLYVTNYASNTLSVIDTATNTVAATVKTGKRPVQIAIDRVGGRLYVANYESRSVSVIGLFGHTVLGTIPVETNPFGIAVDPSRGRGYVSNAAVDTLSVIDTRTDTVVSTVPVGKAPLGLGLDLTGSRLFVAHALDDRVALLDPATGATTRALEVGRTPVAFGPFIGVVANTCPRAAFACDDADPFTADACAAPGGCRHTLRRGLDAVGAGLAALGETVRSAPAGTFSRAPVATVLAGFVGKAALVVAPGLPADPRAARRQQARLNRFLRRFGGLARKGYRSGGIAHDTGARLVDLANATRAAARELRGTKPALVTRPVTLTREIVPPPLGGPATEGR